jgi:protein SCO1/2
MTRTFLATLLLFGSLGAAHADFSSATLDAIAASPQPNARLPRDAQFADQLGKPRTLGAAIGNTPAVIVFADYTCRTLCGPILAFAAGALNESGLAPGRDYHLVVVGIDPKDAPAVAASFAASRIGKDTPLAAATTLLTGRDETIRAVTQAAGYRFAYDPAHDQYAHPAAAYVVTAQGRVSRVLTSLGLNGPDLRLALVEAGKGKIGGIADQIHLLCYGFDPARGIYTASITKLLNIGGATTAALLAGGIGMMLVAKRRRRA